MDKVETSMVGVVVPLDEHHRLQRTASNGVGHRAMDTIQALLHITEHALVIIGPIHRHQRRIRRIGGGALDGHLAALGASLRASSFSVWREK